MAVCNLFDQILRWRGREFVQSLQQATPTFLYRRGGKREEGGERKGEGEEGGGRGEEGRGGREGRKGREGRRGREGRGGREKEEGGRYVEIAKDCLLEEVVGRAVCDTTERVSRLREEEG